MSSVREKIIATELPLLAGEVNATFENRECRVVNVTDPYGRILGFYTGLKPILDTNDMVPKIFV
jgi:hypothetical protein